VLKTVHTGSVSRIEKVKICFLLTHPIQYLSPLFSFVNKNYNAEVSAIYQSNCSIVGAVDKEFGRSVDWGRPLLEGYKYIFLPAVGSVAKFSLFLPFNYGLIKAIRKVEPEILIITGYSRPFHLWSAIVARLLGVKVYFRDDANLISVVRTTKNIELKKLYFRLLLTFVNGFLSVGMANTDYYLSHCVPRDKIKSMPWAIDNEYFMATASLANRHVMRTALGLTNNSILFSFVGKLSHGKGVETLIKAFDVVSIGAESDIHLAFVGDGELRGVVEHAASNNKKIHYAGFKDQIELALWYACIDVLVLPSNSETWGLVINEAGVTGKPVIVSDAVGCWPDLVVNGVTGFVFKTGDVEDLARVMNEISSDKEKLSKMGEALQDLVLQGYNFNVDACALLKLASE
jgi:glycosyltransferase involved in cell wall biosynthesis